ncbi:MAG: hypothetical protein HOE92_01240 [Euryarchaeota archaeon]|jgi:rRNA-processing protein FCF1|nr:hypothetical protein [Euryarchaeota archaeon]MBT4406746.1 hypothetical protein [Euryarchaeota archaeon]MBT6645454.1 hypothetical protein [Euryarchaeota archaeon]
MQEILVDACGWAALIEGRINLDHGMQSVVGPFQLILLDTVEDELVKLEEKNRSNLLLDLLRQKAQVMETKEGHGKHTDDQLFVIAKEKNIPVLTVDKELKKRLHHAGCSVIEVLGGKRLRLIE